MEIKALSIDEIGLSVRARNALHNYQIDTVDQMLQCTEITLLQFRNIGKKTMNEIIQKIMVCRNNPEKLFEKEDVKSTLDAILQEERGKRAVTEIVQRMHIALEHAEAYDRKVAGILLQAGYSTVDQVLFVPLETLLSIPQVDLIGASEIQHASERFLETHAETIVEQYQKAHKPVTAVSMLFGDDARETVDRYVQINDEILQKSTLSYRARNLLAREGYTNLSDCLFLSGTDLQRIQGMGNSTQREILAYIDDYLKHHEDRIHAVLQGDTGALYSDAMIRRKIMDVFFAHPMQALSSTEIIRLSEDTEGIPQYRWMEVLETLTSDHTLVLHENKYHQECDFFQQVAQVCDVLDERSKLFVSMRLQGMTLEQIGQEQGGLTRERVRQILVKSIEKTRHWYATVCGKPCFQDDRYIYLYTTYSIPKADAVQWLGIPQETIYYFEMSSIRCGRTPVEKALEDTEGLDEDMRTLLQAYLRRDCVQLYGQWISRNRASVEDLVLEHICQETLPFEVFVEKFNAVLQDAGIPFDPELYITASVARTRKVRMMESMLVLWKQSEQLRYYDIPGRDFTNLLQELDLAHYENTELSTLKWFKDHPELMKAYDIRDQYELHNLLRKIVPEGAYHGFHPGKMPNVRFGVFDRDSVIYQLIEENAPITVTQLVDLLHERFGYDHGVIQGTYLQPFWQFFHNGVYAIDTHPMPEEKRRILADALTEDFYYLDEVQAVYQSLFPDAYTEEVTPYLLKGMGFQVLSRYCVQHYPTLDAYFTDLLTREEIQDITAYRARFVGIQQFSQTLWSLRKAYRIAEYAPNQLMTYPVFERMGMTRDRIRDFCDMVWRETAEDEMFSLTSLRRRGLSMPEIHGYLTEWFYAGLLAADPRFSYTMAYQNYIFQKGRHDINVQAFLLTCVQRARTLRADELLDEIVTHYGCNLSEPSDLVYKLRDTGVIYRPEQKCFYANQAIYQAEEESV